MTDWYSHCYRKLFFDYHTQQKAPEVGRDFDAARWAQALSDAGVQAVSCIAKCGYGWRYYRKGTIGRVHPHLPEGLDILGDTVRECHKRNIRVIAYFHVCGSEYLAETRPEWRRRDADGSCGEEDIGVCMLGDMMQQEFLPQIGEIAKNYEVDAIFLDGLFNGGGVCYCESCRRRFREETGFELPGCETDPGYEAYIRWIDPQFRRLRAQAAEIIHANRPETLLSVNWAYTERQAEPVPEGIGFMTKDISQSNQAQTTSIQARNWALTGKPFDVMNHMALKWWQEWNLKPAASLMQECALALVNGGHTWMGYQMYPWFGVENALLGTVKTTFDFVKTLEPLVDSAKVLPYVGVLHSESQRRSNRTGKFETFINENTIRGIHAALTRSGIPYNSACDDDFIRHLPEFKAVIVAGNQYLSQKVVAALTDYAEKGGKVLIAGRAGMVDEDGKFRRNPAMEALIGATVTDDYPYSHGYIALKGDPRLTEKVPDMPVLSRRPCLTVKPDTAETLADLRCIYLREDGNPLFSSFVTSDYTFSPSGKPTGTAALTLNRFGKGLVAYFATDVFDSMSGGSQWMMKNLVKNLINNVLLGGEALRIEAPDYVEVALMQNGVDTDFHLVNLIRESPIVDFNGAIENIIAEDIPPIFNIKLTVPMDKAPKDVTQLPEGKPCAWTYEDGKVCVTVDKLEIHTCVRIEA